MSSAGDDRPPERPGDSDGQEPDEPRTRPRSAPEEPEQRPRREQPEYTVYGKGGEERRQVAPKQPEEPGAPEKSGDRPDYKVYKSRPGLRDRFRKPDLAGLRKQRRSGSLRDRFGKGDGERRHWLRWVLIGVCGWLLLSFIAFAVSAQIQKGKLDDSAKEALKGGPDLLAGQNILILGGDRRGDRQGNASGTEGQGPPRADTIMVLHASLTSFRKLSIPRDTFAAIPDCGSQKINASLACNTNSPDGNPGSTIRTVENFLGIPIHHIVIIDFDGFGDFINTLGGVEVDVPDNKNVSAKCEQRGVVVAGDIDGGKNQGGVSLGLPAGETTLEGDKALAFARLRKNECDPSEDDTDRAARQQIVLNGIKGRLTSPHAPPLQLRQGPLDRLERSQGLHQRHGRLHPAPARDRRDLRRQRRDQRAGKRRRRLRARGAASSSAKGECARAVEKLIGSDPPDDPVCSP